MKAARIHEYGDRTALRLESMPLPALRKNDVLVGVHAAGVNPVDALIRTGVFRLPEHALPLTLGWDFAGTVVDVGTANTSLVPGDLVYARPALERDGAFAEYIAVDATEVARAPRTVPLEQAASLPLVTLTAWKALVDLGGLQAAQTVLVHAGAGGVGSAAVQLATHWGAHVVATASGDGVPFVRSLGAAEVIDHRQEDFAARGRFADVVLDTVGGDTLDRTYDVVRPGGVLVTIAGRPDAERAQRLGISVETFVLDSNGPRLAEVADLVDTGVLRPLVTTVLGLEDVAEAQRLIETGRTRGKIVLRVT